jgi:hypothetical protein
LASCGQNRVKTEALKTHARRSCDLTYALAAEWREGCGKTAAGNQSFELISIKLKYLHVILANLSVLRNRCGELAAKRGHRN